MISYIFCLFFFLEGGASVFQGLHNIIHHHALEARWQRDIQPYHYALQPSKTFNEMNTFTFVFSFQLKALCWCACLFLFPYLSCPQERAYNYSCSSYDSILKSHHFKLHPNCIS